MELNNQVFLRNFTLRKTERLRFNETASYEGLPSGNHPIYIGSYDQPIVNSMVPFLVTFYLFVIVTCFNTIYRYIITEQESQAHSDGPQVQNRGMANQSNIGSMTPPPSYSIFIGSGESVLIPPPYKMVFPYLYAPNGTTASISPSNSVSSFSESNDAPPTYLLTCHTIQSEPVIEEESQETDVKESSGDLNISS